MKEVCESPSEDEVRWTEQGLVGAQRFVNRLWDRVERAIESAGDGDNRELAGKLHRTIRRVSQACEKTLHFNTAIAAIMELLNDWKPCARDREIATAVVRLMAPLAPFLAEELWARLGHAESVFRSGWPAFDPDLAREQEVTIVVQVNGKKRGEFAAPRGTADGELERRAREMAGVTPKKVIVVADRLVNLVV